MLDRGGGSAALIIKIAKTLIDSSFIGIDYCGEDWEYSKSICEMNAKYEKLDDRIKFIKASASKLPFDDNEFDVVVSCLTFQKLKLKSLKI